MKVFENVNWELLRAQKLTLIYQAQERVAGVTSEHLTGLVSFIDHFQDCAVVAGLADDVVFGVDHNEHIQGYAATHDSGNKEK